MAYLKACASRLDGGRAHGVRREAPWYPSVRLLGMFWHEKTSVCLGTKEFLLYLSTKEALLGHTRC